MNQSRSEENVALANVISSKKNSEGCEGPHEEKKPSKLAPVSRPREVAGNSSACAEGKQDKTSTSIENEAIARPRKVADRFTTNRERYVAKENLFAENNEASASSASGVSEDLKPPYCGGPTEALHPLNLQPAEVIAGMDKSLGQQVSSLPLRAMAQLPTITATSVSIVDTWSVSIVGEKNPVFITPGRGPRRRRIIAGAVVLALMAAAVRVTLRIQNYSPAGPTAGLTTKPAPDDPTNERGQEMFCNRSYRGDTRDTEQISLTSCGEVGSGSHPAEMYTFKGSGEFVMLTTCNKFTANSYYDTRIRVLQRGEQTEDTVCIIGKDNDKDCEFGDEFATVSFNAEKDKTYDIAIDGLLNAGGTFEVKVGCSNVAPSSIAQISLIDAPTKVSTKAPTKPPTKSAIETPTKALNGTSSVLMAILSGNTYASCQGTYVKSVDKIQGRSIWDRAGQDQSRFIFWCGGKWGITGSQWRAGLIREDGGGCGSFISSDGSAPDWNTAGWTGSDAVAGPTDTLYNPFPCTLWPTVAEPLTIAALSGNTDVSCQGTYIQANDMIQGRYIWDLPIPDRSCFIFWCSNKWRITDSRYREELIRDNGGDCEATISSDDGAFNWYESGWTSINSEAGAAELFYMPDTAECQNS